MRIAAARAPEGGYQMAVPDGGAKTSEPGRAQVPVPAQPTQAGPFGLRFDFNEGCRVALPPGDWQVRLLDADTDTILFDQSCGDGIIVSSKKYFVRMRIDVRRDGELVFSHVYDAAGRDVLMRMEVGGLGDQLAWVGAAIAFAEQHRCRVTCCVRPQLIPLLAPRYPQIRFLAVADVDPSAFYATYKLFIFYNDHRLDWAPCDYRAVGLCHYASHILGLPAVERRPAITVDPGGRPIAEPYVCIATQASGQSKLWNNPDGWPAVAGFLQQQGYRVVCIDRGPLDDTDPDLPDLPAGVQDETGDRPLSERARWLTHAAFFVGLSSGLSWLAWAADIPVVLISGFTSPANEFHTPYRVINWHACNGCSNDIRIQLDPKDYLWCPRHAGTARMFECTRLITPRQVIAAIRGAMADIADAAPAGDVPAASGSHRIAFTLAATAHGPLILNRLDYRVLPQGSFYGVGGEILEHGGFARRDVALIRQLLDLRRAHFGAGVVAFDIGANIGVHAVEYARHMTGWGRVIAIEAQARLYYALAGNLALNNCFNADAMHAAVTSVPGRLPIPLVDYQSPGSFGSLPLRASTRADDVGQPVDYTRSASRNVPAITLDGMRLPRVDLLKIDVEGMEIEVLEGARATIDRCRPIIFAEHLHVGPDALVGVLQPRGYRILITKMDLLAVHREDPSVHAVDVV